jgi:hypothetical protein
MSTPSLTWGVGQLAQGVLRVAFTGRGGPGSEGNPDGERMREAIREVLPEHRPAALVIDLRGFDCRFGTGLARWR